MNLSRRAFISAAGLAALSPLIGGCGTRKISGKPSEVNSALEGIDSGKVSIEVTGYVMYSPIEGPDYVSLMLSDSDTNEEDCFTCIFDEGFDDVFKSAAPGSTVTVSGVVDRSGSGVGLDMEDFKIVKTDTVFLDKEIKGGVENAVNACQSIGEKEVAFIQASGYLSDYHPVDFTESESGGGTAFFSVLDSATRSEYDIFCIMNVNTDELMQELKATMLAGSKITVTGYVSKGNVEDDSIMPDFVKIV